MAQIGTFTRGEDGFVGVIKTLSLNVKARFVLAERDSEKAPDLRAFVGPIEIGAVGSELPRRPAANIIR
jgi:uncharacterized protein (DUF736 family)